MFLVLPQQELVRHPRDIVAHHDMARLATRGFLVGSRHRARRAEVIAEQLFEVPHGTVTVFGDGRMIIDVFEEEAL